MKIKALKNLIQSKNDIEQKHAVKDSGLSVVKKPQYVTSLESNAIIYATQSHGYCGTIKVNDGITNKTYNYDECGIKFNQSYTDYLAENLEKSMAYTEYLAEAIDKNISYSGYISKHVCQSKKGIRFGNNSNYHSLSE